MSFSGARRREDLAGGERFGAGVGVGDGLRHRGVDLVAQACAQRSVGVVIEQAETDEVAAQPRDRVARAPLGDLVGAAVWRRVGNQVTGDSVGPRLDQGRAAAGARARNRDFEHGAERDDVVAVDGHWHASEGEEAVLAACYCGLRDDDWVAPHYRGMLPAACARGADLRRLFAGLSGKTTSYSRGHYRSDVCAPVEHRMIGLYSGALGPTLEYATGAALAARLDGREAIAIAVFGDGTSSRGNAHEAINLAAVLKLPAVFVCQNNGFAISTPSASGVGARSVADRGAAYGIPGVAVDGNDVIARSSAVSLATRARAGSSAVLMTSSPALRSRRRRRPSRRRRRAARPAFRWPGSRLRR